MKCGFPEHHSSSSTQGVGALIAILFAVFVVGGIIDFVAQYWVFIVLAMVVVAGGTAGLMRLAGRIPHRGAKRVSVRARVPHMYSGRHVLTPPAKVIEATKVTQGTVLGSEYESRGTAGVRVHNGRVADRKALPER